MNGLGDLTPKVKENIIRARGEFIDHIRFALQKTSQQANDIDKAVLTLSSGALLLSVTFVGTLSETKHDVVLLFCAWVCFITSILFVILGMWKAQHAAHADARSAAEKLEEFCKKDWASEAIDPRGQFDPRCVVTVGGDKGIYWFNIVALVCFVLGLFSLCLFVGLNLGTKPDYPTHVLAVSF